MSSDDTSDGVLIGKCVYSNSKDVDTSDAPWGDGTKDEEWARAWLMSVVNDLTRPFGID